MKGDGRALLLRRMNIDYFIEWFDYEIPKSKTQSPNPKAEDSRTEGPSSR